MSRIPEKNESDDAASTELTAVLRSVHAGDPRSMDRLLAIVYGELRALAAARMAHLPAGQTLQPTALVHEAYLRLMRGDLAALENRRHFFFAAARAMRDILVEQARRRSGPQRGGDRQRVELHENSATIGPTAQEVLFLHESLEQLDREDPVRAHVVLLRYFAGMTVTEIGAVLGVSESTVQRQWRFARAWLKSRMA